MYENHQKQQYFERNIRKYKRLSQTTKTALENAKNYEKSKSKRKYRKYKYLSSENIYLLSRIKHTKNSANGKI